MNLYQNPNKPEQQAHIDDFNAIRNRYSWLEFFQPQPEKAPWHVKVALGFGEHGEETIHLNFWPHLGKAQRSGEKPVIGYEETRRMITQAIEDSTTVDDFEVIESA